MKELTAVLAVSGKRELFEQFYLRFRKDHPDVPLAVSALQASESIVSFLKELKSRDPYLDYVTGNPKDGHHVSFSENYNSAINLAKTEKIVLVHTDMVFSKSFFEVIEKGLNNPKEFCIYTTMEPPVYIGHRRPGKILGDFGNSFSTFRFEEFQEYCEKLQTVPDRRVDGYGFFLAGFKQSFEDVGGFDQDTFTPVFCEDDDFMVRLRIKGFKAVVLEHAICYHFVSQTSREVIGASMTSREVEANIKFGRKWGFEARHLWSTGYESVAKFEVFRRKIAFQTLDTTLTSRVLSLEPLVDFFQGLSTLGEYHNRVDVLHKIRNREEVSIEIIQRRSLESADLYKLATLIGSLRLCPKLPKIESSFLNGTVFVKTYPEVEDTLVEDNTNYLSKQRSIEYE